MRSRSLAFPVLRHRILTNFTAASEGITPDTVIKKLIEETPSQGQRADARRAVQEDFRIVSNYHGEPASVSERQNPVAYAPGSPADSLLRLHPVAVQEDDPRRFLHPDDHRQDLPPGPAGPAGGRGLHLRHAPQPVLRPLASSSCSTASTPPATTSAISTGRSGRRPTTITSSSTRPRRTCAARWSSTSASRCTTAAAPLNKYNYACTVAACLAYLLLRQQDAVGCITFDSDVRQIVPSRSQQTHIDALVKAMHVSRPREKTDIEQILRRVTESIPRAA